MRNPTHTCQTENPEATNPLSTGLRRVWQRLISRLQHCAEFSKTSARMEEKNWANRVAEEKAYLQALVDGMGTEFLATGEGLQRLTQQLNAIQERCQGLTELTMGHTEDAAVQFAFQLLKKSEDLLSASNEQFEHVFTTFDELQRLLAQLGKQHEDLMHVLKPLSFITTSFRIEASRHPPEVQEVFSALAQDLSLSVNEVQKTLELQFSELRASELIARNLMKQVFTTVQQHRALGVSTLAASRAHLLTLGKEMDTAGAGALDLSQINQRVAQHIGEMVMAQQCEDITRQKVDHVGEALDEMYDHLAFTDSSAKRRGTEKRQFIYRASQIQLQQLHGIFSDLRQAAISLTKGMQNLRAEADTTAEAAVKVGSTSLNSKVGAQCDSSINQILEVCAQSVVTISTIITAFEPLQARFVDCTSKATELASDVRFAALNAQLFAIRAPSGETLEVLARRLRVISDDAILQVEKYGDTHRSTADRVNNLKQRLEDFQSLAQSEQQVLADESVLSRAKLSDLERTIPELIQDITKQQSDFVNAIDGILANVHFPDAVTEANERTLGFFQELVNWGSACGVDRGADADATRRIDKLKANYTMESERRTHTATLHTAKVSVTPREQKVGQTFLSVHPYTPPRTDKNVCPTVPAQNSSTSSSAPKAQEQTQTPTSSTSAAPPSTDLGDNVELF
ncbi:MAG: hypothetical protein SFY80_14405 [Verrucomicrobiota bacterium]|nr:hypothetical protein [Verrucomicrobiota bacterium]